MILPLPQVFFAALQGVGPELTRENWSAALFGAGADAGRHQPAVARLG